MDEATGMTLLTTLKVLYVEDNPVDADLAQRTLARLAPDLDIDIAATVLAANARLSGASTYDVALIDLRLPDGSGLDVLAHIREHGLPMAVVMLTGSSYQEPAIIALKAGADDYLVKPFGVAELLARIRALNRRHVREPGGSVIITFGEICVDLERRQVTRNDQPVHVTPTEFRLLATLVTQSGKVLTHRQLLRDVWGPAYVERSHYLRIYMGHLRQKLEADPAQPRYFLTETGIGYRFRPT